MRTAHALSICGLLPGFVLHGQLLTVNHGVPPGARADAAVRLGWTKSAGFLGDHFTLGARGQVWVIDSIRTWATPDEDGPLGDLYENISLFGGIETPAAADPSQPPQPECDCHNLMTIRSGAPVSGRDGSIAVSPAGPNLWQMDFQDLHWSVPGGYPIQFGVMGIPRPGPGGKQRIWFNRASQSAARHELRAFDEKGRLLGLLSNEGGASPDPLLGINVEVRAHKMAPMSVRAAGDLIEAAIQSGPMFDASEVDVASLRFGPKQARPAASRTILKDGGTELVVSFRRAESGVQSSAWSACVNGLQHDGVPFEGCDQLKR